MLTELELAKENMEKAKMAAQEAVREAEVAEQRFHLLSRKQKTIFELQEIEDELKTICLKEVDINIPSWTQASPRPVLALPQLLPDHSDVDPKCRKHLVAQTKQMIEIFKKLSTKEDPFIDGRTIKKYILDNYTIENPHYWFSKTSPKEPERWWKHVYDKIIERLDLVENLIVRSTATGKKGRYALVEYLPERKHEDTLF